MTNLQTGNTMFLDDFNKIGDLYEYDGPLMSVMEYLDTGRLFIFDWVGQDQQYNHWLVFEVIANDLNKYLNREIGHLQFFETSFGRMSYQVNIGDIGNGWHIPLTELPIIPQDYSPKKGLFADSFCKDLEKIFTYINTGLM